MSLFCHYSDQKREKGSSNPRFWRIPGIQRRRGIYYGWFENEEKCFHQVISRNFTKFLPKNSVFELFPPGACPQ